MKDDKSDPIFSFSTDCIKNGPDSLFDLLSLLIRSFLTHGHVTVFLLLATLVPIIKDKLGRIDSSKNYRSIAISSIILKLLDWIILLLFGATLGVDQLQFAYQPGSSTTMCTWMVIETVGYFLRNGSEVFTCAMDMTKAFDLVKHSLLFRKLMSAGLPPIFIRVLLFIYTMQFANVRWDGKMSETFPLCNGVRQGAILSAILYCFYVNDLFRILRNRRAGCWVNDNYHGIIGYSDDSFLLAPSESALQEMMVTCQEYAQEHNLYFSTDPNPSKCKTRCMAFFFPRKSRELPKMKLCGDELPWVTTIKHLGNNLTNQYDGLKHDTKTKQAQYITKNNELYQEFFFSHPKTRFKTNVIYNSHFTGSPLWDLFSRETEMVEKTWNTSLRIMYELPVDTHRYFVEAMSDTKHVRILLYERFVGFLDQIEKSPKHLPKQLLETIRQDVRSITGRNIKHLEQKSGGQLYKHQKFGLYAEVLKENDWKVKTVK